jgi:hypothetical protein
MHPGASEGRGVHIRTSTIEKESMMEKGGRGREVRGDGGREARDIYVVYVVPGFGFCVTYAKVQEYCVMWCTNGVIHFRRGVGVVGIDGGGVGSREVAKKGTRS